jgi:hypothetical protein
MRCLHAPPLSQGPCRDRRIESVVISIARLCQPRAAAGDTSFRVSRVILALRGATLPGMTRALVPLVLIAFGCGSSTSERSSVPASTADLSAAVDGWEGPTEAPAAVSVIRHPAARPATRAREHRTSRPARSHRRVDVRFAHADLVNALRFLADEARVQLVVDEGVGGTVTLALRDVDPYQALVAIAEAHGARVEPAHGFVVVRRETSP